MTVFGYARVSTLKQADDGYSIDVQEDAIKSYAKQHGMEVSLWLKDKGVSGSTELQERAQGRLLFEKAKKGDVIICSKLDRMFRSARDALNVLEEFKQAGVTLHFIDLGGSITNGIGQLVFTILSAVAEQERTRINERISETKERARKEGKYQGGKVAFGYKKDKKGNLVKDEHQQKCIAAIKKKKAEGFSLRRISDYAKDEWQLKISHNAVRSIIGGLRKIG